MAEDLILNDTYEVTYWVTLGAQTAALRRFYRCSALGVSPVPTDLDAADDLSGTFANVIRPLIANDALYVGASVRRVSGAIPFPIYQSSVVGTGVGGAGTVPLPKQVAGVLGLYTPFAGRTMRGRVYVPFPVEADNELQGVPSAAYVTRLASLGTFYTTPQIVTGPGTSSGTMRAVITRPPYATWGAIISSSPKPRWGTQRRRGDYGAANRAPF
jgi:hypothetical protein